MTEQPLFAVSTLSTLTEPIPRTVVLTTWVNSWLAAHCAADDITTALEVFGPQRVELPNTNASQRCGLLVGLSTLGLTVGEHAAQLRAVLPAPGDPSGLPGPAALNQEAVAVGQAIVIDDLHVALVPRIDGSETTWVVFGTPPDALPSVKIRAEESSRAVRAALITATQELSAMDLAAGRDEVADSLAELNKRMQRVSLPASLAGPERHTIHTAAQILGICEVAQAALPPAPTTTLGQQRALALTELATTARHCLAAAASPR